MDDIRTPDEYYTDTLVNDLDYQRMIELEEDPIMKQTLFQSYIEFKKQKINSKN